MSIWISQVVKLDPFYIVGTYVTNIASVLFPSVGVHNFVSTYSFIRVNGQSVGIGQRAFCLKSKEKKHECRGIVGRNKVRISPIAP